MDEETAGVALVTVPATEVVSSVAGIERPFEMDGVYFSDHSFAWFYLSGAVFIMYVGGLRTYLIVRRLSCCVEHNGS